MARIAGILLIVLACAASAAHAGPFPPPYVFAVQPMGTLPGLRNFQPTSINNLGHVIGNATDASGGRHTFLYDGTQMRELSALTALNATVSDINNHGQIVGTANNQALLYSAGTITYLGNGTLQSSASAINDVGQVVGKARWANPDWPGGTTWQAAVFENGAVRDLDARSGENELDSEGVDINVHGDVVWNYYQNGSAAYLPVVTYADGRVGHPYLSGGPMESDNPATAINDAGQVVGWFRGFGYDMAFMYEYGVTHSLYPIQEYHTQAYAINNRGQILGNLGVWEPNGIVYTFQDLLTPDSTLSIGSWGLINDAGQVVANACRDQTCELVLLNPVPEPAMAGMLAAGAGLIGLAAMRRRGVSRPG